MTFYFPVCNADDVILHLSYTCIELFMMVILHWKQAILSDIQWSGIHLLIDE